MSMNLHLKINGQEYDLWQTPTSITYMCMVNDEGKYEFGLEGQKAKRSLQIYKVWVESSRNGVWTDDAAYEFQKDRVKYHLKPIIKALKEDEEIELYIM